MVASTDIHTPNSGLYQHPHPQWWPLPTSAPPMVASTDIRTPSGGLSRHPHPQWWPQPTSTPPIVASTDIRTRSGGLYRHPHPQWWPQLTSTPPMVAVNSCTICQHRQSDSPGQINRPTPTSSTVVARVTPSLPSNQPSDFQPDRLTP